jgi:hypothetical protein
MVYCNARRFAADSLLSVAVPQAHDETTKPTIELTQEEQALFRNIL